jgi:hypothetical protein
MDDLKAIEAKQILNKEDYESDYDEFESERNPNKSDRVQKSNKNKPPYDSEAESNNYTESENNIKFIDDQNAGGYKVEPEPSSDDYADEESRPAHNDGKEIL